MAALERLENATEEQLRDILSMTSQDVPKTSGKPELISQIKRYLGSRNFNGDDTDYNQVYWFIRGANSERKRNEMVKEVPRVFLALKEFNKSYKETDQKALPKERNLRRIRTFQEWKELNSDEAQTKLVTQKMNPLLSNPDNWTIDFTDLNNTGRKLLGRRLLDFFREFFDNLVSRTPVLSSSTASTTSGTAFPSLQRITGT